MSNDLITKGKTVFFTYRISLSSSGSVVEESDIPIGYVHGHNQSPDKVEQSLEGHALGDQLDVAFDKSESMYPYDPELVFTDNLINVPPEYQHIGAHVDLTNDKGEKMAFFVTEIKDGNIVMDGNHPLAGKDIIFHVTVKTVRDSTDQEIRTGLADNNLAPGTIH